MWCVQSYLGVVDHVDALVDDTFGVLAKELEDVLNLSLVRQSTQADAVLARAWRDHLLRQQWHLRKLLDERRLRLVRSRIHGPVQNLLREARCSSSVSVSRL